MPPIPVLPSPANVPVGVIATPAGARRLSLLSALTVIGAALVSLAGWITGNEAAEALFFTRMAVPPVSALAILLAGTMVLALVRGRVVLARICAASVLVIGVTVIVELFAGVPFATRYLVALAPPTAGWPRPSAAAAFALVFVAAAGLEPRRSRSELYAAGAIYIIVVAVVAPIYGATLLPRLPLVDPIAPGAFLLLLVWALGFVSARADRGFSALAFARDPWGQALRRVIATAFIVPAGVGALCVAGVHAELFNAEFAVAAIVSGTSVALVLVVARNIARMRNENFRRTAAEAALAESEARYRSIVENSREGIVVTDPEGQIVFTNDSATSMLGLPPDAMNGRSMYDFIAPDDWSEVAARYAARKSGAGLPPMQRDLRLRHSDGRLVHTISSTVMMRDAEQRFAGVLGIITDISDRKAGEEELLAQKAQMSDAQELARVGSWTYDFVTRQRSFSKVLCELYGIDPASKPGVEDFFARMPADERERMRALQRRVGERPEPVNAEFRVSVHGELRWFHTRTRYIHAADGTPLKLIGVVLDITETKHHEAEMLQRASQQASIAGLGQIALSGTSEETLFIVAAASVRDLLGVDICEVVLRTEGGFTTICGDGWPEEEGQKLHRGTSNAQAEFTINEDDVVMTADVKSETRFEVPPLLREHGIACSMAAPISSTGGTPSGVLAVHTRTPREFTDSDVVYLRSVAAVLAQAIERNRSERELRHRARQQSAIAELGALTLASCDEPVLQRACELLAEGLGVEYTFFAALLPGGNWLERRAGRIWSDEVTPRIAVTPRTQAGRAVIDGVPVVIDDYAEAPGLETAGVPAAGGVRSGVMVPVASNARTFGVLAAQSHAPARFSAADVVFVQSMGRMLAEAMEREQNRLAVAESEARLRRIVEGAREVIFTIAADGTFVELNPAFETLTGCPPATYIGRPFIEVIAGFDRERVTRLFETMLADQQVIEDGTTIFVNGQMFELAVVSFPQIEDGRVVEIYGFARDITEARRVERERRQLTRELELLLESTADGIFTIDVDGNCTTINRAATELLGWKGEEIAGRSMHDLIHPEVASDACAIRRVSETRAPVYAMTDAFRRRDGIRIPVEYSAAPIIDGEVVKGTVVAFTDVSARRKLEAKLEQASRLSSLGRLAATVAHEFNNVLMGISPFLEILRRTDARERMAFALDHIGSSIARGRRITDDILRFTRPAEPVRTTVEVAPWLEKVVSETRSMLPPNCKVQMMPVEDDFSIEGDPNQLYQIFANLLLNARDAMPTGGVVTVSATRDAAGTKYAFGAIDSSDRYVHFTVSDTGTGMSAETLHHIFEPLFTTKRNGTGLGLAVTHQVIRAHEGEIFAESTLGEGSTFHLFIPLIALPEPVLIAEPGGEVAMHQLHRNLLLVEDDAAVAAGIRTLLETHGFTVDTAVNGEEALARLKERLPDAVILDVDLPDTQGHDLYARIAESYPGLAVVFSTGHGDPARIQNLLSRPNVRFLMKPYAGASLLEALTQAMTA